MGEPACQHVIVAPIDDPPGGWIHGIRQRHDPIAALVPPHVTLVYPFDAEFDAAALKTHMAEALAEFRELPITLDGVSGAEGCYLWYDIKQGNDALIAMHDRLYAGPLARYLDRQQSFQPHLTLGRIADPARWREALDEIAATTPRTIATVRRVISYRRCADGTRRLEHAIHLPRYPGTH